MRRYCSILKKSPPGSKNLLLNAFCFVHQKVPSEEALHWYHRIWRSATQSKASTDQLDASRVEVENFFSKVKTLSSSSSSAPPSLSFSLEICGACWEVLRSCETEQQQLNFLKTIALLGVQKENVVQKCQALIASLQETIHSSKSATSGEVEQTIAGSGLEEDKMLSRRIVNHIEAVQQAITPLYAQWFHQTTVLPNGMRRLLDLRVLLQKLSLGGKNDAAEKDVVKGDGEQKQLVVEAENSRAYIQELLRHLNKLIAEWFSTAWLAIEELSWLQSPASTIEAVVKYEVVHPLENLESVKHRMHPTKDRSCFAFFHPSILNEPLAMVQVALTREISPSVDQILSHHQKIEQGKEDQLPPTTAIFYSINSTQEGLRGIELGKHLIKSAVVEVSKTRPSVSVFSTLSPIPSFGRWINQQVALKQTNRIFVSQADVEAVAVALGLTNADKTDDDKKGVDSHALVLKLLSVLKSQRWWENKVLADSLQGPLMRAMARYLFQEKRRQYIFDPVGHFHVRNGAVMYRLNWLANMTPRASKASACMMINYLYDLPNIQQNGPQYELSHKIATGPEFQALL